jgi:hypothetical protein
VACEKYFVPFVHRTGCNWDRPEVTHCQFVQSSEICCYFHQVAAALPYHCNSVWSAPSSGRWGNSVLGITFRPTRLAQGSITALPWKVGLLPYPHSQSLCLTPLLLLLVQLFWEVDLLPQPHSQPLLLVPSFFAESSAPCPLPFSEAGSMFHPTPCQC